MPQSYSPFNVESPNIDVNLFARSDSAGIAAGNAQKTKTQAIIEGVQEGIKFAADLNQQLAQTKAIQIQNEFRNDPEVRAALEEQEVQQVELNRQKIEFGLKDNEAKLKLEKLDIKAKTIEAQDKIDEADALSLISSTLEKPTPETGVALLDDDRVRRLVLKKPELAQQIAAGLKSVVGEDRLNPFLQTANASEIEQREAAEALHKAKREEDILSKDEDTFKKADLAIQSYPKVAEVLNSSRWKNPKAMPANTLKIVNGKALPNPDGTPKTSAPDEDDARDKTWVVLDGLDVIQSNISEEDGKDLRRHILTKQSENAFRKVPTEEELQAAGIGRKIESSVQDEELGLAAGRTSNTQATTSSSTSVKNNPNITAVGKARFEERTARAVANGYGGVINNRVLAGQKRARAMAAKMGNITVPYLAPQTTPIPANASPVTKATPFPTLTSGTTLKSVPLAEKHLNETMGRNDVTINIGQRTKSLSLKLSQEVVDRMNAIPALVDQPALIKGLVVQESLGKADAIGFAPNKKGQYAGGLAQIMPDTAAELGITDEERFDPDKAIPAAIDYVQRKYKRVETALSTAMSDRGVPTKPDPRMILAAYNGGDTAILASINAINAGNITWDTIEDYIINNSGKSPANMKQNIEYADNVILAAIPFIVGGNASDDAFINDLRHFGIINVPE